MIRNKMEKDARCLLMNGIEIGLSEKGKEPCELCALLHQLDTLVLEARKQVEQMKPVKAYNRIRKEYLELAKTHKTCAGCGLCFGGYHIAFPAQKVDGLGEVCWWCSKSIKKYGLEKFKERLKGGNNDNDIMGHRPGRRPGEISKG